jgi:hypothetical protein
MFHRFPSSGLRGLSTLALLGLAGLCLGAEEKVDLATVHRIKEEAFQSSQVMDHLFQLTDVNGPRLTGSPGFQKAAQWAERQMNQWQLENAHLEPWGPFGRGWTFFQFDIHMQQPGFALLHAVPLAWCSGTKGSITAAVVAAPLLREDDNLRQLDLATLSERIHAYQEQWRGKLRGKIVLLGQPRDFTLPTEPPAKRLEAPDLSSVANAPEPTPSGPPNWVPHRLPGDPKKRAALLNNLPLEMQEDYWRRRQATMDPLNAFLQKEGVAAVLKVDQRGAGGFLFAEAAGSRQPSGPVAPPTVVLAPEQYNRLWRLTEKNVPVEVAVDLQASFIDSPFVANVIGEIPGTAKKDELVMLGAHLDSWHAGTGATDNAAGCAVMLEAMRILKTLQLKMDRTVRLALWSGEEQGLLGSRAYVREHFGDPVTAQMKPEQAKVAAYFNVDNGSGKIRGIYLQDNDMVRPIFEAWLAPFKDLGAGTITIRNTGGTDHLSFDAVGLPGFQFIQDPLDYGSRTHHSDMDVYDHAEPGDLMQAAAIVASFVYNAATRPDMLPRKPLPKPLPAKPASASDSPAP